MSNVTGHILTGVIGLAVGAGATFIPMRKKIKEKQKELQELRKYYIEKCEEDENPEMADEIRRMSSEEPEDDKTVKEKLDDLIDNKGYRRESAAPAKPKHKKGWVDPYLITPEQYGEHDDDGLGWECETLLYFADKVLTDDQGNKIEDMSSIIGDGEVLKHFGEFDDDSIYVRNENRKVDYEVLADVRTWAEAYAKRPRIKRMEE